MGAERFEVEQDATAVPIARRAAVSALRGSVPDDVVDAAELVVSELTGNALLHAEAPVALVVGPGPTPRSARVEVHDGSRTLPVRPRSGSATETSGLTGRGLGLIDAVADRWGVEATTTGKAVWVELTPESVRTAQPSEADLESLLAGFDDWPSAGSGARFEITLHDVPTDLLLAAKVHTESVVRELALTATGAESGVSAALPPHLSGLVDDISFAWAEARHAIKRQAVVAAERGEQRTTLRLALPASAAEEGERYLAALQHADTYGRASRLLTLAAPPQVRAFQRWCVSSLVDALRRAAAGETGVVPPSFESHLLVELEHLATLQSVSERSARLQRASAALSGALSPAAVAETVLAEAVADLGALRGVLLVPDEAGVRPAASTGFSPELLTRTTAAWAARRRTPAVVAWESGAAVWAEEQLDRSELADVAEVEPDAGAACGVPLQVGGQRVGVLSLTFRDSRLFSDDERAFLRALAAVAAQALERAHLHERQAEVAERLIRLQAVTTALTAATDLDEVLDVAIEHATGLVGAWQAALCLLQPDDRTLELCRMVPFLGPGHDGWATFDLEDEVPASEAVRTGAIVYAATVAERDARWPSIAKYARDVEHSMVVLPLHGEAGAIGAISLSFPSDRGRDPDRSLLQAFVDACAQAVERTRAADQARAANLRLAFLARASAELSVSLDVERTLAGVARLAVPEVGDWCVVHLLEDGQLRPLAVEHVDPAKTELAREAQRRWPSRLSDPAGVAQVMRSGEPLLVPDIPALTAQLEAAGTPLPPRDPEHETLLQGLGLQSALIVPLEARGRTLGALTFITAESNRRYGEDDLRFTLDLARRAALALDNARLFSAAAERGAGQLPSIRRDDPLESVLAAAEVGRFALHLPDGRLESDERLASFFGFRPEEPGADLKGFLTRIHPDDLPRVRSAVQAAAEQVGDFAVEHRVVLPSGEVRWIALRGSALVNDTGGSGRLVGVAYDSTTARDVRDRTARLVETIGDAFFRVDRGWRFSYVNGQAEKLLFRGREELLGQSLWEQFPDLLGSDIERRYRAAMRSGTQTSFEAWFGPLDLWLEVRATPDPDGLSVFFHDVTARRRAEQARQDAAARLALLADATRELVGAVDAAEVLVRVVQVLVPGLGEWAIAGLVDDEGRLRDARAVHADPVLSAEVDRLVHARPYALESIPRVARVLTTGAGELAPAPAPRPGGVDDEVAELVERVGYGSALVVPLVAGDATLGIICVLSGADRAFTAEDLATAGDIGRRAGLAVQNAQLFARQRTAVEVLQRSMLSGLPQPQGLELVARYRAAGEEAQVGGDWYDAFLQPDGATVLVIGDVIGHDMGAAAAMGQLRSLLRGTAYDRQESPARVLNRVDSALRGLQIDTLATALVARLEQSSEQRERGVRTLRWSSAGHPPAVLIGADGAPRLLEVDDDLLLGFDDATDRHDHVVEMTDEDTLLLYTDGLVERRDSDLTDGIERLRVALGELAGRPLEQLCDALLERLLPEQADDDVALVAVRVLPVAAGAGAAAVPTSRSPGAVPSTSA